jgi:hypothetical protein
MNREVIGGELVIEGGNTPAFPRQYALAAASCTRNTADDVIF